ncbi:ribosome-binding factor A [Candidatus Falkowbacteria bacterium CG10_big_fil_rev_8_21_14_0_10_37_6]|uniref:Ribosome-binding factor A n=1 Tax=Candidatus Falkowbacteria bacterium CG10_big_fil_rev_8_21_14_0_10_37_6 TaxID=1974563 RepID=A0A2H0V7F1_9BACT|nr:MAG: ribosome-binding factor A [Candidatus Falkowbacteria bacterium CG10_big_fil_rev_8_21_14_0_10_37_6]
MPRRIEQVNELLREKIAFAIKRDVEAPNVLITVADVKCSPDLKEAKVWISILPDNRVGSTMQAIKKQEGLIYSYLKKNTVFRKIPVLKFMFDDMQKKAAVIEQAIQDLN